VNPEDSLRAEIHQALDAVSGPTPELLPGIAQRLGPVRRPPLLATGQVAAVLAIGLVVGAVAFSMHRARVAPATVTTSPTTPIVAGPGANIAWVTSQQASENGFAGDIVTGIDPTGHVVGRINARDELRSPDGSHLYAMTDAGIDVFSAADGHREQTIRLSPIGIGEQMLSADGGYLAVTGNSTLQLVDLSAGRSIASIDVGGLANGIPVIVGAHAEHVYIVGSSIVRLAFNGTSLRVERAISNTSACNGLAAGGTNTSGGLPFRVLADGRTLVAFCPGDGRVTWFDLVGMSVTHEVQISQRNPFWVSPVFSADGNTLYLHEGGTGALHVVDLVHQTIVKSTKVAIAGTNPLAWLGSLLVTPAYAGAIDRTVAVSPDGNWLYAIGDFGAPGGVSLVHLPEIGVKGRWLPNVSFSSVWVSADGQTVYVLVQNGTELRVLRTDGSQVATLGLPPNTSGFIVPTTP
jgi:hypothetical protein